ncbi:hypothetical protein Poli38472_001148 [Pythium oligandrum]|uniref:Rab proteins geranylgeranyltransferase component n=1 Tax=Pythium oligandrum TaxID=41045 RepID=A0A8K1CSD1_PYTOL|nr:hypothetical protein Poli38472_001148 [Pythium oligandrum]|eukprot:TMW68992.1 hypothetical protein Poli38472_001148 [Pythium oligandrum]
MALYHVTNVYIEEESRRNGLEGDGGRLRGLTALEKLTMDATLLETEYDAVVVGTGMAEAILAGALARVGKKVLHLDQNDYYGSNYASFPLEQFLRWTRNEDITPRRFDEDDDAPKKPLEASAPSETSTATRVLPMKSSFQCHLVEEGFSEHVSEELQQAMKKKSSQFSIDVNPRLVLSSEEIVQILITSGVGRYLEFAAIERTYVHFQDAKDKDNTTVDTVWDVPCSKKDVFSSKLLGMVEKRMLMKFLQFVADYGETHIRGDDVKSKNERELALGRSLKRPQNKANQVDAVDSAVLEFLDRPFQELLSKHFKLSTKLQEVVVYCVALASFPVDAPSDSAHAQVQQMTAREGLAAVYRFVASIGRFTGNAFLVPLYGVSEITQSFCRLCAVYGGIYVLRAPIDGFVVDEETQALCGIRCTDGAVIKAKNVITNASYLASFEKEHTPVAQVLRGVFVLDRSLRLDMNRFMVVIPPRDAGLDNPFAIQIIQLDRGAYVCPEGQFLVQITTPLPAQWQSNKEKQQALMDAVIKRLVQSAMAQRNATKKTQSADETEGEEKAQDDLPEEWASWIVWKAVFAMDHHLAHHTASPSDAGEESAAARPEGLPANLWVTETAFGGNKSANPLEIHLESASLNARVIFEQLCPNEEFLPKSASAEQAEQEEEDEDDVVLQAAQKLAKQADLIATSAVETAGEQSEAEPESVEQQGETSQPIAPESAVKAD